MSVIERRLLGEAMTFVCGLLLIYIACIWLSATHTHILSTLLCDDWISSYFCFHFISFIFCHSHRSIYPFGILHLACAHHTHTQYIFKCAVSRAQFVELFSSSSFWPSVKSKFLSSVHHTSIAFAFANPGISVYVCVSACSRLSMRVNWIDEENKEPFEAYRVCNVKETNHKT